MTQNNDAGNAGMKSVFTARDESREAKSRAQKVQHEAVKAAQQQPVSGAARKGGGDINFRDTVLICFDFSLICDPVVSLWKPGVPYPVHGRVLVEIQRPRSLHRKAVIQLNNKREIGTINLNAM